MKTKATKHDYEWAVKLAARYLWCDRGDAGTERLIEVLREAQEKRGTWWSNRILADELKAMIEEQREYRRRVGQREGGEGAAPEPLRVSEAL